MARTPSTMLPLGTLAPDFSLPDPSGRIHGLREIATPKGVVVVFLCNHCPFVRHLRSELADFSREMRERGVGMVGINANDVEAYPADSPERMAEESREAGYLFPYLYDADQSVAIAYDAACTPDFYLFDGDLRLVYRGEFDGSRPQNEIPVTGSALRSAVDALLRGEAIPEEAQRPSLGCNIKWKAGNAPHERGAASGS